MPNPLVVDLTANTWTKVATAVKTGQVTIKNNTPNMYKHTYVLTGESAPTDDTKAHKFIANSGYISAAEDIDVYIKSVGKNGKILVEV
jgi:hypothetical protein